MNPPSFTGSITNEDSIKFVEKLKKVFDMMHFADVESVQLAAYQHKNVARTLFDQQKEGRYEDALHMSWACFE